MSPSAERIFFLLFNRTRNSADAQTWESTPEVDLSRPEGSESSRVGFIYLSRLPSRIHWQKPLQVCFVPSRLENDL